MWFFWKECIQYDVQTDTDMERIGATASREAMRMPISQIPPVSSRAQVGSPLAFPWPNTWHTRVSFTNVWIEHQHMRMKTALSVVLSVCVCLTFRKGTMPSRAMACSRRGAPVKLCSPAPQQEKNEPITITQGDGHDSMPITRFPFTESPNLQCKKANHSVNFN